MTPYYVLKNAVHHRGGWCSPKAVHRELSAYLDFQSDGLKRWGRKFWSEVMTREEWHALCNRRRKRKRRTKQGQLVYESVDGQEVTVHPDPLIQAMNSGWAEEIDEFVMMQQKQEEDDGYYGEF